MTCQSFRHALLLAVAICAGASATSARGAFGDIRNLGTFGGVSGSGTSSGFDVNAAGQVAGSARPPGEFSRAFRYSGTPGSGGVMVDLGTLGGTLSEGYDINAGGGVAGYSQIGGAVNAPFHAFRYTGTPGSGGVMADLGTLGGSESIGRGINASGQVAGYSDTSNGFNRAFRYTGTPGSGGAMVDLGSLGGTHSLGFAINDGGQVTGYTWMPPRIIGDDVVVEAHAFRYTGTPGSGGAMVSLGTLGGTDSFGEAINAGGDVAGYSNLLGDFTWHAFVYRGIPGSGGSMMDLGTLGGPNSSANDINTAGQIVGGSRISTGTEYHAFLYTGTPGVDGQMLDLDAWLDVNNPAEGAKWTLDTASGLTDNGLITGRGEYNDGPGGLSDGSRAFLLDASSLVPEPSGLALLTFAVSGLLHRRRRPHQK